MEQLADVVPMVQILGIPAPQMVEVLLEVFRILDTQMPVEQAIAVPKISLDRIPQRSADLVPQMVRTQQLHPLALRMRLVKGFFELFLESKKSATQPPRSVSELPPHSSPWTPAAHAVPMALRRRRRR